MALYEYKARDRDGLAYSLLHLNKVKVKTKLSFFVVRQST